jgi:hypothetical protein
MRLNVNAVLLTTSFAFPALINISAQPTREREHME